MLSRLIVGTASVAMISTIGLLSPAQATPGVTAPDPQLVTPAVSSGKKVIKTNAHNRNLSRITHNITVKSVTRPKGKRPRLNYKTADKWDEGQYTLRRQYAAAFSWNGGDLTNISSAELKKVKAMKAQLPARGARIKAAARKGSAVSPQTVSPMAGTNCTGRNKTDTLTTTYPSAPNTKVVYAKIYWLDSCETNKAYAVLGIIGLASGYAGAMTGKLGAAIGGLVVVLGGAAATWIWYCQSNSNVNAVKIKIANSGNGQARPESPVWVYSQ